MILRVGLTAILALSVIEAALAVAAIVFAVWIFALGSGESVVGGILVLVLGAASSILAERSHKNHRRLRDLAGTTDTRSPRRKDDE